MVSIIIWAVAIATLSGPLGLYLVAAFIPMQIAGAHAKKRFEMAYAADKAIDTKESLAKRKGFAESWATYMLATVVITLAPYVLVIPIALCWAGLLTDYQAFFGGVLFCSYAPLYIVIPHITQKTQDGRESEIILEFEKVKANPDSEDVYNYPELNVGAFVIVLFMTLVYAAIIYNVSDSKSDFKGWLIAGLMIYCALPQIVPGLKKKDK